MFNAFFGFISIVCLLSITSASIAINENSRSDKSISAYDALSRSPSALLSAVKSGCSSFASASCVFVPIGLVLNVGSIKSLSLNKWVVKGASAGFEWAKFSAFYSAGETLSMKLRGKNDKYNSYVGSGLTSALIRIEEGPIGMIKGFAMGYGLVYAIEKFMAESNPAGIPNVGIQNNKKPTSKALLSGSVSKSVKRF